MICFYKKTLINAGIQDPAITVLGNGFGKIQSGKNIVYWMHILKLPKILLAVFECQPKTPVPFLELL